MSTLALVRHGQASFFADNYDQLSPLGEEQARLLGDFWARYGERFDEVYVGPRVRQIETAAIAGQRLLAAGLPWPEAQMLPEFDEHQVDRLIKQTMTQVAIDYPDVGKLHADYVAAELPHDKQRTFQLMFERVVMMWVKGEVAAEGVEPWQVFAQRVRDGLAKVLESERRGRRVAVFTSVGAVTVCLQACLGCDDRTALDLGWRVRNCSITEFVFGRGRLTLEGFNALSHLNDPQLWTFR